ncbi:MAG: OPT/YSL family transporter [Candidatus Bathyarchaeia archaeon]
MSLEKSNNVDAFTEKKGTHVIKSGVSFISAMAILYSILVFIPATMYLSLMVGGVSLPAAWFTLIFLTQLGKVAGFRISKQEATMIYIIVSTGTIVSTSLVYFGYFRASDIALMFGVSDLFPDWLAPHPSSEAYKIRTLFHPSFVTPILIRIGDIAYSSLYAWVLSILLRKLYIIDEDLPFPIQQMEAEGVLVMSESKKSEEISVLFASSLVGVIYGLITYALPLITKGYTGVEVTIIPLPWIDLSESVMSIFPGAIIGVGTDLSIIASAFILPLRVIVAMVIGSFAIFFFGNWLSVKYNLALQPWWAPRIPINMAIQRCIIYLWGAPLVGLNLAAGLMPIIFLLIRGKKKISRSISPRKKVREEISIVKWFIFPLILCWVMGVFWYILLAPQFPLWIAVPSVLFVPLTAALIDGRMIGITGQSVGAFLDTNLMRLIYMGSNYKGVDVWFLPTAWRANPTIGQFVADRIRAIKLCDLTDTSIKSFFKMWIISFPMVLLAGIIYLDIFWRLAPIPSARYPGAAVFWPIAVSYDCLWIKGAEYGLFRADWIILSFVFGMTLSAIFELLSIPVPFIALVAGTSIYPPVAVTYILGALVRIIILKYIGKEKFENIKMMLSAGLMMGLSISVIISISINLLINSIWNMPF